MKTFIKLLLLAAVALPSWSVATAQESSKEAAEVQALAKRSSQSPSSVNAPQKVPMQEVVDFTVAEGTATSTFAPICGAGCANPYYGYTDYQTRTQMVYPSSMLAEMPGNSVKYIKSITFYTDDDGIQFGSDDENVRIQVLVGTTNSSYFSSNSFLTSPSGATASVTPNKGDKTMTVTFGDPFEYSSGNMLIEVRVTQAGTAGTTNFVGVSTGTGDTNYQSRYSYRTTSTSGSNTTGRERFLPKVTFGVITDKATDYTVSTENVDFGNVKCGASKTINVTFTNTTSKDADISWEFTGVNANKFSTTLDEETVTSLAAGQSLTFPITFTPVNAIGAQSGSLKLQINNTLIQVRLSGTGEKDYAASVTPTSLDFGEVVLNGNGTATVTLTNTGLQAITPIASTNRDMFTVSADGTGALAAGGTRNYTVTFAPTEEEEYTGVLTIKDDAHSIRLKVNLKGKGVTTLAPYVVETSVSGNDDPNPTVCDATTTTTNVPLLCNYIDYGCEGQMIYTAELLGLNIGDKINSLTFYATGNINHTSGEHDNLVTVKVGETSQETLSALITTGLETKCTSSIWSGDSKVTFTFDSPYEYQGGNLVVDLSCPNDYSSSNNAYWGAVSWYAASSTGSSWYMRLNQSGNSAGANAVVNYLPKMTLAVDRVQQSTTEYVRAEEVAWGEKNVASGTSGFYSKTVTIYNPNSAEVTATLTTTEPFYFDTNKSTTKSDVSLPAGNSTQILYFNPTAAAAYTGHLTITVTEGEGENVQDHSSSTRLTGVGLNSNEIATRDEAFFAGITYKWPINADEANQKESNLAEIATDPDQIIAMLRKVYMDQTIPGNYYRGYPSTSGTGLEVNYSAVGTLTTGSTNLSAFADTYGWKIQPESGDILYNNSYGYYLNPKQFWPKYEGVTLLLLEMVDDFDPRAIPTGGDPTHDYAKLRDYFEKSIKSARVVTDAKRVGSGDDAATLFKIDCDKMNKFCFIAKGQLGWFKQRNSSNTSTYDFSYPFYNSSYGGWLDYGLNKNYLDNAPAFLCHMFEQLSPAEGNSTAPLTDGYQMFVTDMKSFGINHDCPTVPFVSGSGHHFMMYGQDSEAADCQDIRDMMFIVPDYRMLEWEGRGNAASASSRSQDYFSYNKHHKPTIGVFVIRQDEVNGNRVTINGEEKDMYKLQLTWKSNLDDYLPGELQEYQLWEQTTDAYGVETYVPVYYRNQNGDYTDKNGTVVTTPVPIVLDRSQQTLNDEGKQVYTDVYVKMENSSQRKTYVIRGQDKTHFLSLQMSNDESYVIPGLDKSEVAFLSSATYYSRYNPQDEKNCYSNRVMLKSNPNSIKESYFKSSEPWTVMTLTRTSSVQGANNQTITTVDEVAKITVNRSLKKMYVVMDNQAEESEYPLGRSDAEDARRAGYHANPITTDNNIVFDYTVNSGYINFDIDFWDNFVAEVSKNEHPGRYVYGLTFTTNETIDGTNTTNAHSNEFPVPVYKTDSKISKPHTLAEVLGDTKFNTAYSPDDVEFQEQVQLSSKQNILRYDAYRWNEGEDRYIMENTGIDDEDEGDIAPTGIAGNQGDYYTVSMNAVGTDDYYVGDNVVVNTTNTTNWATFVDYYPTNSTEAGAYVYAPVVELFGHGYQAGSKTEARNDYNTYGGPLQNTAIGKLELKPLTPTKARPLMSDYWWEGNGTTGTQGEKYSYYNVFLSYDALDVPEGYEIYKLRAWRKVDKDYLGEELKTRRDVRIGQIDNDGWYMYEDINFGNPLKDGLTMSCSNLKLDPNAEEGPQGLYLGERSATIAKPQNPDATGDPESLFGTEQGVGDNGIGFEEAVRNEMRATFGARRLDTADEDNDFPRLDAEFKVRIYFVKTKDADGLRNPLVTTASTRVDEVADPADFDYYVAEGTTEFHQEGGSSVITGISAVKMDVNREVVGVSYVNTIGQVSGTPWQGVNIVVTRYSDGSTTTKKVIK